MLNLFTILAAAVALTPGTECKKDADGFCFEPSVLVYNLSPSQPNARLKVNCLLGYGLAIELPDGDDIRVDPVIGNTEMLTTKIDRDVTPVMLTFWPKAPKENMQVSEILGVTNNVQISLKSGITIILEIKITNYDSVQRVVFTNPQKAAQDKRSITERMRELERLEADLKAKAQELEIKSKKLASKNIAKHVMAEGKIHCKDLSIFDRTMSDLLKLRGKRICQVGDQVYVTVEIKNRARADEFLMKGISVVFDEETEIEPELVWQGNQRRIMLKYNQSELVTLVMPANENTEGDFDIKLLEASGKKRIVVLEGVGF